MIKERSIRLKIDGCKVKVGNEDDDDDDSYR